MCFTVNVFLPSRKDLYYSTSLWWVIDAVYGRPIIRRNIFLLLKLPSSMANNDWNSSWTRYFDEVSKFLSDTERRYGVATANYCENVLDRLDCIYTCTNLHDSMDQERDDEDVISCRSTSSVY